MNSPKLILASGSPRRRALLQTCGIPISMWSPHISQRKGCKRKSDSTVRLSEEKSLANRHHNAYVLAADTIVCLDEQVFEKPLNDADAITILSTLSGKWHTVITAWAIAHHPESASQSSVIVARGTTTSEVKFRSLQMAEIKSYIQTGEGRDKAGSYGIQGLGAALVESIRGDYSNIVGLPMGDVIQALGKIGIAPTEVDQ